MPTEEDLADEIINDARSIGIEAKPEHRVFIGGIDARLQLSLHTADPGETGEAEVTYSSYARASLDGKLSSASLAQRCVNIEPIMFPTNVDEPCVVSHMAIWMNDQVLVVSKMSEPITMVAGTALQFDVGSLSIGLEQL